MSARSGKIVAVTLALSLLWPVVSMADDAATRQDELQRALAAEDQQRAELKGAQAAEVRLQSDQQRSEWLMQLVAALRNNWAYPPGTDRHMKAVEEIALSASGQVIAATIKQSSGSPVFDRTLLLAAYKASPLPLPPRPELFVPHLVVCFSPDPANCQ